MTLAELAQVAGAELAGAGDVEITAVTELEDAHPHALVMVADARRLAAAEASPAGALLVWGQAPATAKPAIRARSIRVAFARVLAALAPAQRPSAGVHPTAVVAPGALVAEDATVGALAVIEEGAIVGARSVLHAGVSMGERVRIGADCVIYPHVCIYADCVIGDRVIVHSGAVIGADGFGYATDEGALVKIPHLGRVVIEDDVEVGANTTIDRATLGETRVGRGSKIDNLVQLAHNVRVGAGALILGQAGISGSATIGDGAIIAGQAGLRDHVRIGMGARVVGQAGVTKDVPPGATVSGYPARDHREALRLDALVSQLPQIVERIRALEARLDDLTRSRRE